MAEDSISGEENLHGAGSISIGLRGREEEKGCARGRKKKGLAPEKQPLSSRGGLWSKKKKKVPSACAGKERGLSWWAREGRGRGQKGEIQAVGEEGVCCLSLSEKQKEVSLMTV